MVGRSQTGYDIATGTYDEARAMIGQSTEARSGAVSVNEAMIRQFAGLVHDANAGYWDAEFARDWWGGTVSPPAMLMTWLMPFEWAPGGALPFPLLTARVPLPGDTFVNASNETEYFLPILEGDHLRVVEELLDVSGLKRTALGEGHFVTTRGTYRRQDGAVVAVMTNVLFRFTAGGAL
jgi:acyl dehydratase